MTAWRLRRRGRQDGALSDPVRLACRQAHQSTAGFTLIEVLAVLAILAMLGALLLSRGPARNAALEMRLASDAVAHALRLARSRSMATGSATSVEFDGPTYVLHAARSARYTLPPGTSVVVTTRADDIAGSRAAIVFLPDGSSSGGRIELTGNRQRAAVVVNWLTGRVTVAGSAR